MRARISWWRYTFSVFLTRRVLSSPMLQFDNEWHFKSLCISGLHMTYNSTCMCLCGHVIFRSAFFVDVHLDSVTQPQFLMDTKLDIRFSVEKDTLFTHANLRAKCLSHAYHAVVVSRRHTGAAVLVVDYHSVACTTIKIPPLSTLHWRR